MANLSASAGTAGPVHGKARAGKITTALRIAETKGLLDGPKTMHFSAKVSPKLFAAAAERLGTTSPAAVINAALAALAAEDDVGPWLARNRGILADTPKDILDLIDI